MAGVVGVTRENCTCAVELLGEDEARESVSEREGPQREKQGGAGAGLFGPAIGRPNGEDYVLRALIATVVEPGGEAFGSELATAAIKKNRDGWRPGALLVEPLEKRGFGFEGLG